MEKSKAGSIILSEDKKSILLIYRGKQQDYTFPKGHVEENEKLEESMRREVLEETGLTIKEILAKLPPLIYIDSSDKKTSTYYWLCSATGTLKIEKDGDILEWIPINEVKDKLSYENLKEYFESIKSFIK